MVGASPEDWELPLLHRRGHQTDWSPQTQSASALSCKGEENSLVLSRRPTQEQRFNSRNLSFWTFQELGLEWSREGASGWGLLGTLWAGWDTEPKKDSALPRHSQAGGGRRDPGLPTTSHRDCQQHRSPALLHTGPGCWSRSPSQCQGHKRLPSTNSRGSDGSSQLAAAHLQVVAGHSRKPAPQHSSRHKVEAMQRIEGDTALMNLQRPPPCVLVAGQLALLPEHLLSRWVSVPPARKLLRGISSTLSFSAPGLRQGQSLNSFSRVSPDSYPVRAVGGDVFLSPPTHPLLCLPQGCSPLSGGRLQR